MAINLEHVGPRKSQTPMSPPSLFEPFRQAQGPEPVERAMEDTANAKKNLGIIPFNSICDFFGIWSFGFWFSLLSFEF
jgi:hypothetical protein